MPKIALATCSKLPQLDDDERRLLDELRDRGADVAPLVWTEPQGWEDVELCVLRCVWDYHHQRDLFLSWYEELAGRAQVWNPVDVVRWNTDKTYLRDLMREGIRTVPTVFADPATGLDLADLMVDREWEEVVLKPAVSADGFDTKRVPAIDANLGQEHLESLFTRGTAMVQPFYPEVLAGGEHCVVFIDGEVSHAVQKRSIFTSDFVDDPDRVDPTEAEVVFATEVIEVAGALGFETLYGRVDMVEHEGELFLMELELTEPSLYYTKGGEDLARLAGRIMELAGRL